jgi:ABC-type glutathione transport system ATPase component
MSAEATASAPSTAVAVLEVRDLRKEFHVDRRVVTAVDGVSFTLGRGETLGLVGQSGSGKSTVARLVLRLLDADAGSIRLGGRELVGLRRRALRSVRRQMQMVFQDPASSLDPRMAVEALVSEPLRIARVGETDARVRELVDLVGLGDHHLGAYVHELSGGQRQRVAIARALALAPDLLVLDEPVSSLDSSIQAQILNLLSDLQTRLGLAYLFIGHDLAVVRHVADRIAVMHEGRIVETAPTDQLFERPDHPVTAALLAASAATTTTTTTTPPLWRQ